MWLESSWHSPEIGVGSSLHGNFIQWPCPENDYGNLLCGSPLAQAPTLSRTAAVTFRGSCPLDRFLTDRMDAPSSGTRRPSAITTGAWFSVHSRAGTPGPRRSAGRLPFHYSTTTGLPGSRSALGRKWRGVPLEIFSRQSYSLGWSSGVIRGLMPMRGQRSETEDRRSRHVSEAKSGCAVRSGGDMPGAARTGFLECHLFESASV
jgi:hypothetical protein